MDQPDYAAKFPFRYLEMIFRSAARAVRSFPDTQSCRQRSSCRHISRKVSRKLFARPARAGRARYFARR